MSAAPYNLPIINIDVPRSLDQEQISALHALVLYLSGLRGQQVIFKNAELTKDHITNFKQGRLKFDHNPDDLRLREFDKAVYKWFDQHERNERAHVHVGVVPLLRVLYPESISQARDRRSVMDHAAEALYVLFDVSSSTTLRFAHVLVGVYHLYRRGDRENSNPELVRNALRITLRNTNGVPKLVYSLSYKRRDVYLPGGGLSTAAVGVVIPHGDNVSLAGLDRGANDSPTLCILNVPTTTRPEKYYGGLQLRKNTAKRLISARCLLVRKTDPLQSEEENQEYYESEKTKVYIKENTKNH